MALALSLGLGPCVVYAEEVRLICTGFALGTEQIQADETTNPYTGARGAKDADDPAERPIIHEIRFDEDTGTFAIRGTGIYVSRDGSPGEWVSAPIIFFLEREIHAQFPAANFTPLTAVDELQDPNRRVVGRLDRNTGIWRVRRVNMKCEKAVLEQRKF